MGRFDHSLPFQPLAATDSLIDQDRAVRFLIATLRNKTIPNALLFTGIDGVGKKVAADAYAMAANCREAVSTGTVDAPTPRAVEGERDRPNFPCGRCRACRKILSGHHPDILRVHPDGAMIKVGQIRELCQRLAVKPHEASLRVVIVTDAGTLNPESGNAMLKVLEEPPDGTMFILTAFRPSDLLPTIVSRCQQVRFNPVSVKRLQSVLAQTIGADAVQAEIIAAMANGSMSRALELQTSGWVDWRRWLLQEVNSLPDRSVGACLLFAEYLARKREQLEDVLDVVNTWFRDLVIFPHAPERVVNKDMIAAIRQAVKRWTAPQAFSAMESIDRVRRRLSSSANTRLAVDTLIMHIAKKGYEESSGYTV